MLMLDAFFTARLQQTPVTYTQGMDGLMLLMDPNSLVTFHSDEFLLYSLYRGEPGEPNPRSLVVVPPSSHNSDWLPV